MPTPSTTDLDDDVPFVDRPAPPRSPVDLARDLLAGTGGARAIAAAALAAVAVVAVAWFLLARPPAAPPIEDLLPMASPPASVATLDVGPTTTAAPTVLLVHAAGAVLVPGVHELAPGSRVADVLAAAGGPAPDADVDAVNLAAPVADGDRVWFPHAGEVAPGQVAAGPSPPATPDSPPGPVNLNTATADELDALPGIGPATATAIVEHRDRDGPFATVDELIDVPGIGPAKLDRLRPLVRV